jgi:hypothetical protein
MKEFLKSKSRYFFIPLGALAGYLYYYYIGCNSGGCPIQSNPYFSTMYGALIGLVLTLPDKKKKAVPNESDENNN